MYVRSERERHMAANSGRTETMHRIVPMRFRRFAVGSNSCRRCRTMPLTPYSVSNGSVSRNANGFAFAPHIRKMPTAAATRRISTHRPMPLATFSEMRAVYSLSPASRISVMGESTHRKRRQRQPRRGLLPKLEIPRRLFQADAAAGGLLRLGFGSLLRLELVF